MLKVKNMKSHAGNDVPNQFIITANNVSVIFDTKQDFCNDTEYKCADGKYQYEISSCSVFQSYNALVCIRDYVGRIFIDERYYQYSKTTSKYLSQFLGMDSKEIAKAIKDGKIYLCEIFQ